MAKKRRLEHKRERAKRQRAQKEARKRKPPKPEIQADYESRNPSKYQVAWNNIVPYHPSKKQKDQGAAAALGLLPEGLHPASSTALTPCRHLSCMYVDECIAVAAAINWPGMTCKDCPIYQTEQRKQSEALWLRARLDEAAMARKAI